MRLKRLISLFFSTGVLSSLMFFSGVSCFATLPSQLCDLKDCVKEDEKSDLRLCLSKNLSKYNEPIDKEFLDHMIDTMDKIAFANGGIAESVEDAGYIGNVLLANSDLARFLYLYPDNIINGNSYTFDMISLEHRTYSLYDILFTIYWWIVRMHSCPHYNESLNEDPFDNTLYMTILNKMLLFSEEDKRFNVSIVRSLNYNFLLAKALINKGHIPLRGSLMKLENFMKEIFKYVKFQETSNIFDQLIVDSSVELHRKENGDLVTTIYGSKDENRLITYLQARDLAIFVVKIDKLFVRGCFVRCPQKVSSFRTNEEIALSRRQERRRREEIKQAEEKKNKELEEKKQREFEKNEKIFKEIKLKFSLKKQELRKRREAEKAMEESKYKKSDEELRKENEEIQNEQFRCFCESECARSSKRKSKSKKSSKSKKYSKKIDVSESGSSPKSISSSESTSSSVLSENSDDDLKSIFETEGNNKVEMKIDGGKYELFYEPSLFSNLKEKNDASAVENIEKV